MTMHREFSVEFHELYQLSIPCRKCQTRVLLDCRDDKGGIPDECPSCGKEYEAAFRQTLTDYRAVYRKLSDPNVRGVEVRIAATAEGAEEKLTK